MSLSKLDLLGTRTEIYKLLDRLKESVEYILLSSIVLDGFVQLGANVNILAY